jgi:hypothetical protein
LESDLIYHPLLHDAVCRESEFREGSQLPRQYLSDFCRNLCYVRLTSQHSKGVQRTLRALGGLIVPNVDQFRQRRLHHLASGPELNRMRIVFRLSVAFGFLSMLKCLDTVAFHLAHHFLSSPLVED